MENEDLVGGKSEQSPSEIYLVEENSTNSADHKSYFWEGYGNNENYCLLKAIENNSSDLKDFSANDS